jgi:hypothetical protein
MVVSFLIEHTHRDRKVDGYYKVGGETYCASPTRTLLFSTAKSSNYHQSPALYYVTLNLNVRNPFHEHFPCTCTYNGGSRISPRSVPRRVHTPSWQTQGTCAKRFEAGRIKRTPPPGLNWCRNDLTTIDRSESETTKQTTLEYSHRLIETIILQCLPLE